MNNIEDLIGNSISIIKKSSLFIVTIFSFFSGANSINTTNPSVSPTEKNSIGIQRSVQETSTRDANKILNVLNHDESNAKSNGTSSQTKYQNIFIVPINTDKIVEIAKKLNQFNLIAPDYANLGAQGKNKTGDKNVVVTQNTEVQRPIVPDVKTSNTETQNFSRVSNSISITAQGSEEGLVNIRCENRTNNTIKVITGSGVIISSSGLILTAAHVAAPVYSEQNGGKYNCYARIKNPATGNYPVKVVFINPEWVSKYYSEFDKTYSETGENDIAILQIDNSNEKLSNTEITNLNNTAHAILSTNIPNLNDSIEIKSYPADLYGKSGVFTVLPRKSESNSINGLFNFSGGIDSPFDLIETKPSSLGQPGASGGGIFNNQGQLIGIISNMVSSDVLFKSKIRALSIKYIDNEIKKNLGKSVFEYNK